MENTRKEIKNKILNEDGSLKFKFGPQVSQYMQKYLTPNECKYLSNIFGRNLSEKIYCIIKDIKEQPKCICGKPLKFLSQKQGYQKYCSDICILKDIKIPKDSKTERNETLKKDHNSQTFGKYLQSLEVQEKRKAPFNYAKYDFHGELFDSSWELAYWIYNKDMGSNIKRNHKGFNFTENGKTRKFYPDFCCNGSIVEIKGDQFKELKCWKLKEEICKKENIKVVYSSELTPMFDYIYKKYGKNYLKQFQIKKDSKRKIIEIKQGDDIFQYRNSNIKFKFQCEECKKEVITSYSTVSRIKELKCKNCRKRTLTN